MKLHRLDAIVAGCPIWIETNEETPDMELRQVNRASSILTAAFEAYFPMRTPPK